MKIIYLIPKSAYATELRSDTFWGMLCWGIRFLWGGNELGKEDAELKKFINTFLGNNPKPEFVISSVYPFKQHGGHRTPYFPNPLRMLPSLTDNTAFNDPRDEFRVRKLFKKVKLVSLDDFEEIVNGKFGEKELLDRIHKEYILDTKSEDEHPKNASELWQKRYEYTAPRREELSMTHNTIDRIRGGTLSLMDGDEPTGQLFHTSEFTWSDPYNETNVRTNTGLYFLADGDTSKLEALLGLFRHWGLGADRTAGKGFFDFEIEEFNLPEASANDANALLNLSLYHPTESELADFKNSNGLLQYELVRRQGWVCNHPEAGEKHARRYFSEGSVFKKPLGYTGRSMGLVQAQPDPKLTEAAGHSIYDYGMGFMVQIKWHQQ